VVVGRECAEGESDSLLQVLLFGNGQEVFFCNRIVESSVEMVEVEGGIAVFLSERFGN